MKSLKKISMLALVSGIVAFSAGPAMAWTVGSGSDLGLMSSPQFTETITSGFASFDVPNTANPNATKLFIMEVTMISPSGGWPQPVGNFFDPTLWPTVTGDATPGNTYTTTITDASDVNANLGNGNYLYAYDLSATIVPQPGSETVTIPQALVGNISSIYIETECVPEPATFSLLALGALALLRRRQGKV